MPGSWLCCRKTSSLPGNYPRGDDDQRRVTSPAKDSDHCRVNVRAFISSTASGENIKPATRSSTGNWVNDNARDSHLACERESRRATTTNTNHEHDIEWQQDDKRRDTSEHGWMWQTTIHRRIFSSSGNRSVDFKNQNQNSSTQGNRICTNGLLVDEFPITRRYRSCFVHRRVNKFAHTETSIWSTIKSRRGCHAIEQHATRMHSIVVGTEIDESWSNECDRARSACMNLNMIKHLFWTRVWVRVLRRNLVFKRYLIMVGRIHRRVGPLRPVIAG